MAQHPTHIVNLLKNMPKGQDFHRTNMFEVEFTVPKNSKVSKNKYKTLAQNLVKSVNIPRTSVQEMEIRRMGRKISIPAGTMFEVVVMNIHDDVDSLARGFFIDWQRNYFGDIQSGIFNADLRNVIEGEVKLWQLDSKHKRTTQIILKHAYPQTVQEMELNHDSDDSLLNFNVMFLYSYIYISNSSPFTGTT